MAIATDIDQLSGAHCVDAFGENEDSRYDQYQAANERIAALLSRELRGRAAAQLRSD